MKISCLVLLVITLFTEASAQSSVLARDIFNRLNEARVSPARFLEKYKTKIQKYNPKYVSVLEKAQVLDSVRWDVALENMSKEVVEFGTLRPIYKGANKMCGRSSGNSSGRLPKDPLEYVCELYTNVHDKDYQFIGLYFNSRKDGYAFYWGKSCIIERKKFTYDEKVDTTEVDFELLNTGVDADYMTASEKKMLQEINFVRAYPKVYAQLIALYLSDMSRAGMGLPNDMYKAGMELIDELKTMDSLSILLPKSCVYDAAKQHGIDCKTRGFADHMGSDKRMPWDRIAKSCNGAKGNENIIGHFIAHPRVPVILLLLDAGISTRGHRYNMLDKNWKYAAVFRYDDPRTRFYWIQNFSE